ncbi:MAG: VacJ family lipoprotein [Leptothrix sp. (in: b-proteobacteria)]
MSGSNLPRCWVGALVLGGASLLVGCATAQKPDPLEPLNRKVFAFNEAVDQAVLKPVATVYHDVVPSPVRRGVGNFFYNVKDVWSAVNLVLQGRPVDGLRDLARFGTNTVFGVFGFIDVATDLGLERHGEDFGQTLGRWGLGPGAYIVWPILGPSSVRDSVALPIEYQITPETWITPATTSYLFSATKLVNTRSDLLSATSMLDDISLDKYTFVRSAYLQRRRSLVYDGNPPDEEPLDGPDPALDAPLPASAAASAGAMPASSASAASAASGH